MKSVVIVLIFVIFLITQATGFNILCVYPTLYRSHFTTPQALLIGLAQKGHNVTVVSPYPLHAPIEHYHDVTINLSNTNLKDMSKMLMETAGSIVKGIKLNRYIFDLVMVEAHAYMVHPKMRQIMNEQQFDVILLESVNGFQLVGLGEHFNCPVIYISSHMTLSLSRFVSRTPFQVSTVPNDFLGYVQPMSFFQRVHNWLITATVYIALFEYWPINEQFHNKYFPPTKYSSYLEATKRIGLYFTNSHDSESNVQAYLPNTVQIGGIHLKEGGERLGENLENWMDSSDNGVILVSMGSVLSCSDLTPIVLDGLLNVFRAVKQNVLWNCNDPTIAKAVTKNVRLEKWSPQTGILAHRNTKLIISHVGLGAYLESIYYGVRILAIPMVMDQFFNSKRVLYHGIGIEIQYPNVNQETLLHAVQQLLHNDTYSIRVKHMSQLYKDRPMSAMDTGIYWVEYVVRYKGAQHLSLQPHYFNIFQFLSLDVIAFLLVILYIVLVGFRFGLQKIFAAITAKPKLKTS